MSKRLFAVISAILLLGFVCQAKVPYSHIHPRMDYEYNNVGFLEFEIGVGPVWGCSYEYNMPKTGFRGLAEIRANLPSLPIDLGFQFTTGRFSRKKESWNSKGYTSLDGVITGFCDYNFRVFPDITPFIGIGIGGCSATYAKPLAVSDEMDKETLGRIVLNPRAGLEIAYRIRMTAEYKFMADRRCSFGGVTLGWVFGGGSRYYGRHGYRW